MKIFHCKHWYVLAAVITWRSHFSFSKSWCLNIQIRRNKLIPKISPNWDSVTSWHWISCPGCWHHVSFLPWLMGAVTTKTSWLVIGLILFCPLPSLESPGLSDIVSLSEMIVPFSCDILNLKWKYNVEICLYSASLLHQRQLFTCLDWCFSPVMLLCLSGIFKCTWQPLRIVPLALICIHINFVQGRLVFMSWFLSYLPSFYTPWSVSGTPRS